MKKTLLFITVLVLQIKPLFAEAPSVEPRETRVHEVNPSSEAPKKHVFKDFFSKHKEPSVKLMLGAFGQPKLSALYIGDAIAKQRGEFKPTLNRSAWIYELDDENLFISIQVDNGKVLDVYLMNRTTKKSKLIRERSKQIKK